MGAGDDEQSIAAAAAAAAAAASAEAKHIQQHQYKDLMEWLAVVQGMSGQRTGGGDAGATAEAATPVGVAEHSGSGLGTAAAEAGEAENGDASRVGCEGLASTAAAAQQEQVKMEAGDEGQPFGVRASKRARKGHREPNPDEVDGAALQDTDVAWVHTQPGEWIRQGEK